MVEPALTAAHQLAATRLFLTKEDVDDIQNLVRMLPKRVVRVIDLGAGSGTTALAVFCERTKNIKVLTVDIDPEALYWAEANLKGFDKYYPENWFSILTSAKSLADSWILPKIDLLLHDAEHTEEAVFQDITAWLPSMTKNGIIWIHDYKGNYPGVAEAIAKFGQELEPLPVSGIGWAGKLRR